MTITLDHQQISIAPFTRLARFAGDARDGLAGVCRDWIQAAILRRVDRDTLEDIGFSADYVRAEWQDFATDHPSLVAPSPCDNGKGLKG